MWIWLFAVHRMCHIPHNGNVLQNGRLYTKNKQENGKRITKTVKRIFNTYFYT